MIQVKWDKQLIEDCDKVLFALDKGRTISGNFVTDIYNKIYGTKLKPTNCHTCIVDRSKKIKQAYDKMIETVKDNLIDTLVEIADDTTDETTPVEVKVETVKAKSKKKKDATQEQGATEA